MVQGWIDEKRDRSLDEFRAHPTLSVDQAVLYTNPERILRRPINMMKAIKQLTLNGEPNNLSRYDIFGKQNLDSWMFLHVCKAIVRQWLSVMWKTGKIFL